jgi:phenylacetate-CoA ligase
MKLEAFGNLKGLLIGAFKANRTGLTMRYKQLLARKMREQFRAAMSFSIQEYDTYQKKRLLSMLAYAVEHVPYYVDRREIYSPERFAEEADVKSILAKLVVLEKSTVRSRQELFYSKDSSLRYRTTCTGGTTGSPLVIHRSIESFQYSQASIDRLYCMGGVKWSDKLVGLTGFFAPGLKSGKRIHWRDILGRRLFMSMAHLAPDYAEQYAEILNRYQPKAYFGYAPPLYHLARMFEQTKLAPPASAVAAFSNTEVLYPEWRKRIESVLGVKVYDQYGCQESCGIAYDCQQGNRHIVPEQGIIEVVDNQGNSCPANVEGEILMTGLVNKAMPLIRYKVGDRGVLGEEMECSCGLKWPILKTIVGRVDEVIWTPDNRPVMHLSMAIRHCKGVEQGQFVQDRPGHINVLLVVSDSYRKETESQLRNEIVMRSSYPYEVDFEYVEHIPWTGGGKCKVVIDKVGHDTNSPEGCLS